MSVDGLNPNRDEISRDGSATRFVLTLIALALLLVLAACGDDAGSDGGSAEGAQATSAGDATAGEDGDEDAADDSDAETAEDPGAEDTGEVADTADTADTGDTGDTADAGGGEEAEFDLVASPDNAECSYVPGGHLSGADSLNVHFYFLIFYGYPPDVPLVSVTGDSDTGLSASLRSGPYNEGVKIVPFALRSSDFGRTHTLTVTVDAEDEVTETDEGNNRIRVTVSLPSPRPSSAIDPLACSVSAG